MASVAIWAHTLMDLGLAKGLADQFGGLETEVSESWQRALLFKEHLSARRPREVGGHDVPFQSAGILAVAFCSLSLANA